jgi:ferredoxin-type protein NapH
MDCFRVCPEPQVITPALRDLKQAPLILSSQCTNCGRCIDVCGKEVFCFSLMRFAKQPPQPDLKENTP